MPEGVDEMTNEEIVADTKTVAKSLETLHNKHSDMLTSLTCVNEDQQLNNEEDRVRVLRKSLDNIRLGLGEAQVRPSFHLFIARQ